MKTQTRVETTKQFLTAQNAALRHLFLAGVLVCLFYAPELRAAWQLIDPPPQTSALRGVTFGSTQYVAVGISGVIASSADGLTWQTNITSGTTANLNGVAFGGGKFVAVGAVDRGGGAIVTSTNGADWEFKSSGTPNELFAVAHDGQAFIAVGDNGAIVTSADGETWQVASSGATVALRGVAVGTNKVVAVGAVNDRNFATILSSTNRTEWEIQATDFTGVLRAVAYAQGMFVAVGAGGGIVTSADGITWVTQTSGSSDTLNGVAFASTNFMAVGAVGTRSATATILSSTNGVDWQAEANAATNDLFGIGQNTRDFVAVGGGGVILFNQGPPPPILITRQPQSVAVALNGTAALSVIADGQGQLLRYQWFQGASGDTNTPVDSTLSTFTTPPLAASTAYWVQINGRDGASTNSASATVTVVRPPSIATQPADQLIKPGLTVTLTVDGRSSRTLSYQWYGGVSGNVSLPVAGATDKTFTTGALTQTTNYWVRVTDDLAQTNDSVTVTIRVDGTAPSLTVQSPSNNLATNAITVLLSGTASDSGTGDNGITNVTINGQAAANAFVTSSSTAQWTFVATLTNAGANNFEIVATDGADNRTTNGTLSIVLDTNAPAIAVTNFTTGQTVNSNSVTLRGTATDSGAGDQGIVSVTVNGQAATSGTATGAGTAGWNVGVTLTNGSNPFQLITTDGAGNKATNQFSLTFTPNTPPSLSGPTVSPAAPICEGTNVTITVSVTSGTAPFSYQWYRGSVSTDLSSPVTNGGTISGATTDQLQVSNIQSNQTGGYFVVVTNAAGAVTSSVATVTVIVPPSITMHPVGSTNNPGETVNFTVVATGSSPAYQWQRNGANLANGGNISGATAATLTVSNITTNDAGSYRVVITNAYGVTNSSTALLSVNGPPFFTTSLTNQTTSVGSSVTFVAVVSGTSPQTNQWHFNSAPLPGETNLTLTLSNVQTNQEGTYSLIVSNVAGSATNSATLTVNFPPVITTQPTNLTVVRGQSASFTVVANGKPTPTYQWRKNLTNMIVGATAATYTINSTAATDDANYDVVVSNSSGSTSSASARLTVNGPVEIITQPQSATVNRGATLTLSVVASGTTPITYQWRLNTTNNIPGATNATYSITNIQTTHAGSYDVVLGNVVGSTNSAVAVVTVAIPAGILTHPSSQTVLSNSTVTFTVVAEGTGTLTYQWTRSFTNIPGATSSMLTLNNVTTNDNAAYRVIVGNGLTNVTSDPAILNVVSRQVKVGDVQTTNLTAGGVLNVPVALTGDGTEFGVSLSVAYDTNSLSLRSVSNYVTGASLSFTNLTTTGQVGVTITKTNGLPFGMGSNGLFELQFAL